MGSNLDHDAAFETRATMFGKGLRRDDRSQEALLSEALAVAQKADVIVAALGESAEMSGECSSRTQLEIPTAQKELLRALLQTGKPVILVLFNGRPLVLNEENQTVSSILDVWFPGSEAGLAIADVLFGDENPSGKLTTTFPRSVGQIPIYYSAKNTGRPLGNSDGIFEKFKSNYIDERNDPLFPFGYGLSYTQFSYSAPQLSQQQMSVNDSITVAVSITNTGDFDGQEVVQMYIRDLVGSSTRPLKELKGFEKIKIAKGETKTVQFVISADDLKFYNSDLVWVAEPGEFEVFIGGSSATQNNTSFTLKP
jgi:beta-glucosidase